MTVVSSLNRASSDSPKVEKLCTSTVALTVRRVVKRCSVLGAVMLSWNISWPRKVKTRRLKTRRTAWAVQRG